MKMANTVSTATPFWTKNGGADCTVVRIIIIYGNSDERVFTGR